jgi:DNA-binding transcriptional regulator YhcF (GntR family)
MLDPQVTHLLETAVDTSCKLAIVLRYADQPSLCATPNELAARICRDPWSVQQALRELADDGVVQTREGRFVCATDAELRACLQSLRALYNDPLQRGELHLLIRELERYAPYRNELGVPRQFMGSLAA